MAIQFNCISCLKAIEVADEWRNRLVECPYCGDTVTAPGMSQLKPPKAKPIEEGAETRHDAGVRHGAEAQFGAERAITEPGAGECAPSDFSLIQSKRSSFDGLAAIGLALGVGAILLFGWVVIRFVTELLNRLGPNPTPEAVTKFLSDAVEVQAPWLLDMALPVWGVMGVWFAGVLISGIAIIRTRREGRGTLAYWALGVNLILPILTIFSMLLSG